MTFNLSMRRRLWLQHALFLLLFGLAIGLLAWLSVRYPIRVDWTVGGRNTLSAASQALLTRLDQPIRVTAYIHDRSPLRESIVRLIDRYRHYKTDIQLHFVNPDLSPDQVRQRGISADGELYVEYGERGESLRQPGEPALTQILQRLSRPQDRTVVFLDGHGERQPQGVANHDLGAFGQALEKMGIRIRSLELSKEPQIPADTATLVIASPQTALTSNEMRIVLDYVRRGGNLLWLLEPDDPPGWLALAALLGITRLPGVVVDAEAPRLGISHPAFIPIVDYAPHPISTPLRSPTLLPQAVALEVQPVAGWQAALLLESQISSWTETGVLDGTLQFDANTAEHSGPLPVGIALSRTQSVSEGLVQQRIVVMGDGDFLSNTYLGNGANLELGLNILNWLVLDEALIMIPPRAVADPSLHLSESALAWLALVFLVILPVGLMVSGWLIWFYRRRQ